MISKYLFLSWFDFNPKAGRAFNFFKLTSTIFFYMSKCRLLVMMADNTVVFA